MTENELRKEFVDKAISYVGVKEGSNKHKEIIDGYNKIVPLPSEYRMTTQDAWCATFVSFIAYKCDLLDIIPAECSCNRQIALWKKLGRWQENDAYVPKTGDIIYYSWKDNGAGDCTITSDHVGIVVSVSNGSIKVIEGNKNDAVSYRTIAVNGKYIRGYGLPNFASKSTSKETVSSTSSKGSVCQVELSVLKQGNKGGQVKALQALLVGYGYSIGASGIDGSFGPATLKAVKAFQAKSKIDVDGSVGPITWKKLLGVS